MTEIPNTPKSRPAGKTAKPETGGPTLLLKAGSESAKKRPGGGKAKAKPEAGDGGRPSRRRVVFLVEAEPGSKVFVAGSFNGWNADSHPMTDKDGEGRFERHIYVGPGALEYKFVIDGEWVIDARCPAWVPNSLGSLNSLIEVR